MGSIEKADMLRNVVEYEEIPDSTIDGNNQARKIPLRSKISLLLLILINFLNYMDRYTISSVLPKIQDYFDINNTIAGLLQTIFTCSYMVFAPIFGYMGDRFPRKYVMAAGIIIWSVMTFAGSLMNSDEFWLFFAFRALVGIGEASYSTVAPTIIADLFVKDQRTKALSFFYFAIPCGSGLGYIAGSNVAGLMHDWRWALRVTPGFGLLCAILSVLIIHEPKRGAIEVDDDRVEESVTFGREPKATNYVEDLKYLLKVKSFVWATVGTTCISFVAGSVAFWAPKFFTNAQHQYGNTKLTTKDVSSIVGLITFAAGITGVVGGAEISRRFRHIHTNAEALVCGCGVVAGAPIFFFALFSSDKSTIVPWILVFLAETLFCMYWVPNADLRLAVIIPTRRSTAEAVQILTQHLLGDAASPFIVGAISDALSKTTAASKEESLLNALYITPFFCVLGGGAYLICSLYLSADKLKEQELVKQDDVEPPSNIYEHGYQIGTEVT